MDTQIKTNEEKAKFLADQLKPCSKNFYDGFYQGVLIALNVDSKNNTKRMFKTLDEMNLDDVKNNTRLVAISNTLVAARKVKQGCVIEMGADESILHDIINEKVIPIVVIVNKEEYFKRHNP